MSLPTQYLEPCRFKLRLPVPIFLGKADWIVFAVILANEIIDSSPTSIRLSLSIMRDTEKMPDELAAVRWKHPALDEMQSSEDMIEGSVAFAQKRKPQWKNR